MPIESVKWAPGRKQAFIDWIDSEIQDAERVQQGLIQQWIHWLELYRAPVRQPERNFPYEGASNYMLPVTATDVDQLYASFIQTIHASESLWTIKPLNERWIDAAKPLQDFLTWLDGSLLHMYGVNKRVLNEMVKLGTGIYKHGWLYEQRKVLTYDREGRVIKALRTRGGPFVDHVRLPDFLLPPTAYDIDPDAQGGAAWVAERMRVSVDRLRWMASSSGPLLPDLDKESLALVLKFEESTTTDYDASIQRAEYEKRSQSTGVDFLTDSPPASVSGGRSAPGKQLREIEFREVHARFPSQGDSSQDDIIGWYHPPTRRLIRDVYNYYDHGKRPFEVIRYFPGDGFYGMGVCEQKEVFQLMQSDLFNFNWDNVLLANSRMIVAKAGQHIAPGESFYPNKIWITEDDVRSAFAVFPMADIYQSLPLLRSDVQAMGERRTGISDIQLGNLQQLPGRTPATTMLSLLQEGKRRPDLTIKDMRYGGISTVGLRVLQVCQQFMAQGAVDVGGQRMLSLAVTMLGLPEGMYAAEKLTTPLEAAEFGIGVSITATSGSANSEVERQNYLALMQLAGQLAPQFIQLMTTASQAQQMGQSQIAEVAINSAFGLQELFRRLLERYDIRNAEEILPLPDHPSGATGQLGVPPGAAGGPGVPAGPVGGPGGIPAAAPIDPGLAALFGGTAAGL